MNTEIGIEYRNANNDKSSTSFVLLGQFTKEQFEMIPQLMHEGEFFVPREIGLPNPAESAVASYGYDDDMDHGLCYLPELDKSFDDFIQQTTTTAKDYGLSVQDFIDRLTNANHDGVTESLRLQQI